MALDLCHYNFSSRVEYLTLQVFCSGATAATIDALNSTYFVMTGIDVVLLITFFILGVHIHFLRKRWAYFNGKIMLFRKTWTLAHSYSLREFEDVSCFTVSCKFRKKIDSPNSPASFHLSRDLSLVCHSASPVFIALSEHVDGYSVSHPQCGVLCELSNSLKAQEML